MINEDALLAKLISALKAHGHSITSQRVMIFRALARRRDHPTAEDLYEELQQGQAPDLSLATVYKNLHVFEEIGLVRAVASPDGRARFDVPLVPHHHLFCTRCGAMVDVDEGVRVEIGPHLEEETGFRVTGVELVLEGVCPACQGRKSQPRLWRQAPRPKRRLA